MDMIVDRLSKIELAAARIVESAVVEKKQLEAASQERIKKMDADIEHDTEHKLKDLKETLDTQMNQELSELREHTQNNISMIEKEYETFHDKLANDILNRMIMR